MGNEMGNNNTSGLREEDNTAQEKSQHEIAHGDDLKGQNHVFAATENEDSQGKETGLVSGDLGREDPKGDDKKIEEDNMKTEASLQDTARKDDDEEQSHEVPASKGIDTNETVLASIRTEKVAELHDDNHKQDEKEQDNNMSPEAKEQSLEETAYAEEAKGKDHLVPAAEDENSYGNETEPDGISSLNVDNQKQVEKEKDNSTKFVEAKKKSLQEAASTEDEKEEDTNISDEAKRKSSREASSTDVVERQDHLLPAVENKNTNENDTELVSSDPEQTADPHDNDPTKDETEEDQMNAEPQEKPLAKDDQADNVEEKNLTIPAAEGEDCNNTEAEAKLAPANVMAVGDTLDNKTLEEREKGEAELHPEVESTEVEARPSEAVAEGKDTQPVSSSRNLEDQEMQQESNFVENLSEANQHFENQNSTIQEDEGTRNSISDAASSTSHDSVPEEPAIPEPELAKINTEHLLQVRNGFNLDSSISPDAIESVFPDPSLEVENERDNDDLWVKEMATKEVSSEEIFESRDGGEAGNHLGNKTTTMPDLSNGVEAKCNGELPSEMNSIKNASSESQVEAILSDDQGIVLSQKAILVREDSGNGDCKQCQYKILSGGESTEKTKGMGYEEGSKTDEPDASPSQLKMNGHQDDEKKCLLDASRESKSSGKDGQSEKAKIVENGCLIDASVNYQNEAKEERQKDTQNEEDTQNEVHLIIDPTVISTDTFLTDQNCKEEETEEKKIIEEMVQRTEDSNPIGNDTSQRENGEQRISRSYPIEQAEAFLSPSHFLHALPEKLEQDSHMESKTVQNSNMSMAELKQECQGEFPLTKASSLVIKNLTEKNLVSEVRFAKPAPVTMAEIKPSVIQTSEPCGFSKTLAIDNGDYSQPESVERLSTQSSPDNMNIHAQMRKSPSFDLHLGLEARAEESDQTPLLYQDKTTIESFSIQAADVNDPEKPVPNTEYGKNSLKYEAMPVEEKVVTLERSDSEKSKTPFLGFLKEEEEADHQILVTPKKQDNGSAGTKITKVPNNKDAKSGSTKGNQKRKPRTSLFGTCMCCATVIN